MARDLGPNQLSAWLDEMVRHPLEPWEANGALNPGDPHQNPEVALQLESDGVPVWWPRRHPRTLEELGPERRRQWFLEWLGGQLSPRHDTLQNSAPSYRRRIIAQSLVLTLADGQLSEIPLD